MLPLWPHQQLAIDTLTPDIEAGGVRVVAAAPTGAGKSLVMRRLCQTGMSTTIYTHRRMLLDQMAEGLRRDGIRFGVVASSVPDAFDPSAPVQLCMVQTVAARMESGRDLPPRCQVVHDDEAHADKGARKKRVLDHHHGQGATVIGWTATPIDLGHLYDKLAVFATNSDLRRCGAHVPADTYAPSEIDLELLRDDPEKLPGSVYPSREYRQAIYGEVKRNWEHLNPDLAPTLLFAPGVSESMWFAQHFTANGYPAAHIDGSRVWVDGQEHESTPELRQQVTDALRTGELKLICNRFVLREGVDIQEVQHLIYATPMQSLAGYLQAGGRVLRAHHSHNRVCVQDHGGNFYRHGSLNSDREWDIEKTDAELVREHAERMVKSKERGEQDIEPIVCPKCGKCRASGIACLNKDCGYQSETRTRKVLQINGRLREIVGDVYRPRKVSNRPADVKKWISCYWRCMNAKRPMSFRQAEHMFKRENGTHPDPSWPMMPLSPSDMHLKVRDVPRDRLVSDRGAA